MNADDKTRLITRMRVKRFRTSCQAFYKSRQISENAGKYT